MRRFFLVFAALLLPQMASAQGMVTSADPRATQAGQAILRQGGSAADAAMAMMLALTVVEPESSGIGGGGFLVHFDGKTQAIASIDGREAAPAAATPQRFLAADGTPLPFLQAFPGGSSIGVPGNVRLLALTHRKWGKLPWAALFQPAIRLAEQGYQVTPPLARMAAMANTLWKDFPAMAALYAPAGKPVAVGDTIRNPQLAATLRQLADKGPDAFYGGDIGVSILKAATTTNVRPSDMIEADLATYRARERAPVCRHYRVYIICGMGPPSSGATTVLQILGMLERFDLKALGKDNPVSWHLMGEAMELAYADREKYLGDPDFIDVPVAGLLDKAYVASRSALISPTKTLAAYTAGNPPGGGPRTPAQQAEVPGTTHFIAVDKDGDVATMTSTVEGPFGSQLLAGGFVLNNELTDFTFAPEQDGAPVANAVAPGKRPLSSMAPTIVFDAKTGKPVFSVGAAGGKTIIMQVAKALIAHLDWGLPASDSIGLGLVFFDQDGLVLEEGTDVTKFAQPLTALGHHVTIAPLGLKANAAEWTKAGWVGAADPRSVGTALNE